MRLIGTIPHQSQGLIFSNFLKQHQIDHQIEMHINQDWGSLDYGANICQVWIRDEDQVNEAKKWLTLFLANPHDPLFNSAQIQSQPILPSEPAIDHPTKKQSKNNIPWDKQPLGMITTCLLVICALLMIFSETLTPKISPKLNAKQFSVFISPIDKAFLYDYPYYYELVDQYIQLYGDEDSQNMSAEAQQLLQKINHTSVWQGIYPQLLDKDQSVKKDGLFDVPMFEKINQGQVWRLFSPALLHSDIFHLFFNMIWLIVLGKQIEQRLTSFHYLLFILLLGVFSNTLQYLAGGPNFIGFSGILCGMLTFIWERKKLAPWEGYDLSRMTFLFMMVFIFGMAGIQFLSFFAEKSFNLGFSTNVANVAHLSGALLGYLIGKTNIFSWRYS